MTRSSRRLVVALLLLLPILGIAAWSGSEYLFFHGQVEPVAFENGGVRLAGALAGDTAAAVRLLRGRRDIAPDRIGLFGRSQGGWIGPLAATLVDDIAFVIMSAGCAVSPADQGLYRTERKLQDAGVPEPEIRQALAPPQTAMEPLPPLRLGRRGRPPIRAGGDRESPGGGEEGGPGLSGNRSLSLRGPRRQLEADVGAGADAHQREQGDGDPLRRVSLGAGSWTCQGCHGLLKEGDGVFGSYLPERQDSD